MLTNAMIIDSTRIDLVSRAIISYEVIVIVVTQVKDGLYHNWFPTNMFFFLLYKFSNVYTKVGG